MDKPGLQRALPYMIVAFIASLMLVYAIRSLQNMDPVWINENTTEGAQVGLVVAAFASMGAFMWGIGAFDPKMSEHGDHSDAHEEVAPEKEFVLRTDGWLYFIGFIQYKFGLATLEADPFYPPFSLPGNTNTVSLFIGYILWVPLFLTMYVVAFVAKMVSAVKNTKYRWFNLGNFLINWIINVLLLPIWIIGALLTRVILAIFATIFIALGVPVMILSWALQIVSFYLGQFLTAMLVSVGIVVVMFVFALLPHGLSLRTVTEPNADAAANGFGEFVIPIEEIVGLLDPTTELTNQPIPGTSQFAVFLGFIIIIFVSLAVAGGLIALFFYFAHQGVMEAQQIEKTDADLIPPMPVREVGKVASVVNRVIYAIPEAIGYKK